MIVSLQVTSTPICSYRLACLLACGEGGVEGLPGEAGAAPADGKLRALAIMGEAVGGVEVGAALVLISCFSQWWVVASWVLAVRDWAWMCSVMIEVLARPMAPPWLFTLWALLPSSQT